MSATLRRPVIELDDPLEVAPAASSAPAAAATVNAAADGAAQRSVELEVAGAAVQAARPRSSQRPQAHGSLVAAQEQSRQIRAVATDAGETWRAWSGASRVASFRLPDELLDELDARAGGLGVPLGMTVAAGLLHLFDQDDETVLELVDRAEATRDRARREARRRTPTLRARTT